MSIRVGEFFHIPVINADSRQIFREIPIGTAAPTTEQQARVKHYLVGTHELDEYYSASSFEQEVLQILDKVFAHEELCILAGGSMMYIDAVCDGIDDIPTIREDIRKKMKQRLEEEGLEAMTEELRRLDPEHYKIVDLQNPRRVIHALEICYQTGQTYTSFRKRELVHRPFRIIKIGITRPRQELYERINHRVEVMMASGLLDEAKRLYPKRHLNALNTVGYKELFNYLDGIWTLDEAVERIKGNTRRYCRKQLTWFKRDTRTHWFNLSNAEKGDEKGEVDNCEDVIHYIQTCLDEHLHHNPS